MRAIPMLVAPRPLLGRSVSVLGAALLRMGLASALVGPWPLLEGSILGTASVWMGVASTVVVALVQERNGPDH